MQGDDILFYYKHKNCFLISEDVLQGFNSLKEEDMDFHSNPIFYIGNRDLFSFRSFFKVTSSYEIFHEDLTIIKKPFHETSPIVDNAIKASKLSFINSSLPNWEKLLSSQVLKKFKVNVVGLGDVGGTLITGLRLLGGDVIDTIGIYDLDDNKVNRWLFECNAIYDINNETMPKIERLSKEDIFNCDMFVFCVSVGVPEVGNEKKDVRLIQFEGNKKIMSIYAKMAREACFNGIFAVVSDPVDLLCKVAFNESNKNNLEQFDFKGLMSHQIKGYGLGVMNARAIYYSSFNEKTKGYEKHGRAFGPHGEGLIIANSIENYDENLTSYLTEKTKNANLDLRSFGFKPYIAPALSSGALSLLATLRQQWNYSSNFIGGTFMGMRNKNTDKGIEIETFEEFPKELFSRLSSTYDYLKGIYH